METFAQLTLDFLAEKVTPQMMVFPVVLYNYIDGLLGEDYWITRYIGGLDGNVILSRTHKRKKNIPRSF